MGGSAANLAGLSSSASHPDLAAAYLQSKVSENSSSLPLGGSQSLSHQSLSHLAGSGQLNPGQVNSYLVIFLFFLVDTVSSP